MWNRIYAGVLVIAAVVTLFTHWYAESWLSSIAGPAAVIPAFWSHAYVSLAALLISFAVLLVVAGVSFWMTRSAWQMWASLAFFVIAAGYRYFWIFPKYTAYLDSNGMIDSGLLSPTFTGLMAIVGAGIIVYTMNLVMQRMYSGIFPERPTVEDIEPPADIVDEDENVVRRGHDDI